MSRIRQFPDSGSMQSMQCRRCAHPMHQHTEQGCVAKTRNIDGFCGCQNWVPCPACDHLLHDGRCGAIIPLGTGVRGFRHCSCDWAPAPAESEPEPAGERELIEYIDVPELDLS